MTEKAEANSWQELNEMLSTGKDIYDIVTGEDDKPQSDPMRYVRSRDITKSRTKRYVERSGTVPVPAAVKINFTYGNPENVMNTFVGHTIRKYRLT